MESSFADPDHRSIRRAARSIKAYLGIRDAHQVVSSETLFGIDVRERNFARIKLATNAETRVNA